MNYQQALDYIYSFANFETRPASQQMRADYTLDRIRGLLAELGNPQDRYPTVHVAGTKGKGSTAAMLASILTAAGYRAGLYTSPHLHTYRERIRIGGQLINEKEVVGWIEEHRRLLDAFEGLTTFEVTTAMAFDTFAREEVDIAVIEVGLGGRLDTTNVITPVLSVITPISLDHTDILGDTIARIACDKAGIVKPGVPAVIAPQVDDAMPVIQRVAGELRAPLVVIGREWMWSLLAMHPDGQSQEIQILRSRPVRDQPSERSRTRRERKFGSTESIEVGGPTQETLRLWMPLIGAHEAANATVAVAAAHELRRQSFSIDTTAISEGVRMVEWPGRTEVLSRRPWIMVDGAHNGASARCLLDTVEHLLGRRRITLIFGASVDKRIDDMFEVLLPATHRLVVTQADHPRAASPGLLAEMARRHGCTADVASTVAEALLTAVQGATDDGLLLATGSLFIAAEARMAWFAHTGRPLPPRDPARSVKREA